MATEFRPASSPPFLPFLAIYTTTTFSSGLMPPRSPMIPPLFGGACFGLSLFGCCFAVVCLCFGQQRQKTAAATSSRLPLIVVGCCRAAVCICVCVLWAQNKVPRTGQSADFETPHSFSCSPACLARLEPDLPAVDDSQFFGAGRLPFALLLGC